MSVPITVNGKFLGVAGADYDLEFVQKISKQVSKELFNDQGEVAIISGQGLLVAESKQPELIGDQFKKIAGKTGMKV